MAKANTSQRYFKNKPLFSFTAFFCIFLAIAVWLVINRGNLLQFFNRYGERNKEQSEVNVLEKNLSDLEEQKKILELGGFENEKVIRERYLMIKPGEKIVILKVEDSKKK